MSDRRQTFASSESAAGGGVDSGWRGLGVVFGCLLYSGQAPGHIKPSIVLTFDPSS